MAAPTIDELTAGLGRVSDHIAQSHKDSKGLVDQFTELLKVLIPLEAGYKIFNALSGQVGSRFALGLDTLTKTSQQLQLQRMSEEEAYRKAQERWLAGNLTLYQMRMINAVENENKNIHAAQVRLVHELNLVGRGWLVTATALFTASVASLVKARQYSEAVQEANSSLEYRLKLLNTMATVQAATGASSQTVASAAKALVRYNLDSKAAFADNLKTVIMLHDSLGMSADEAGHLAAVAENYARVSFQRVADAVTTVVDQTALAASEAKNLGIELMRAMNIISPRPAQGLPQVIEALGAYEGALKEVTGQIGGFQKLVNSMATPEGLMAAGMLGVTPEMIRTREGIEQIMARFDQLVQRQVGNAEGMERVWRLENVARMLNVGLTREELAGMSRAMELRRTQATQEISLQQRYQREVLNLDQGFGRLFTSLMTLLERGIYPFVKVLAYGVGQLSLWVQKLVELRYAGYAAFGLVTATALVTAAKLKSVARAFLEVVVAAQLATNRLREHAVQQMLSGGLARAGTATTTTMSLGQLLKTIFTGAGPAAGGAAAAAATMGWRARMLLTLTQGWGLIKSLGIILRGGFGLLFSPLSLILAASGGVLAIVAAIKNYNKMAREDTLAANRTLNERSINNERLLQARVNMALRRGDTEGAMESTKKLLSMAALRFHNQGLTASDQLDQLAKLEEKKKEIEANADRAVYTRTMFSQPFMTGKGYDQGKTDAEVKDLMKRIADATDKTKDATLKSYMQEEKTALEHEDHMWIRWVGRAIEVMTPPGGFRPSGHF